MNGKVYQINPKRGMVAVLTENGDFTIIEIIGSYEIDIGDELTWKNDTALGSEQYRNITKKQDWGKMTLGDTKVEVKYLRRRCQNGKDSKSDLHEGASRGSSEARNRRGIKDTGSRT